MAGISAVGGVGAAQWPASAPNTNDQCDAATASGCGNAATPTAFVQPQPDDDHVSPVGGSTTSCMIDALNATLQGAGAGAAEAGAAASCAGGGGAGAAA